MGKSQDITRPMYSMSKQLHLFTCQSRSHVRVHISERLAHHRFTQREDTQISGVILSCVLAKPKIGQADHADKNMAHQLQTGALDNVPWSSNALNRNHHPAVLPYGLPHLLGSLCILQLGLLVLACQGNGLIVAVKGLALLHTCKSMLSYRTRALKQEPPLSCPT